MRKMLCVVVAALAAGASASAASADSGMTMQFGSPSLSSSRVAITVPVTVSCSPLDPTFLLVEGVSVSVEQSSGTGIAHGMASVGDLMDFGAPLLFPCDSANHTLSMTVLADTSGRPFHGGPATFSGSALVVGEPCPFCFGGVSEAAQAGPTTLTLH
jgi:hypothetical protein